MKIDPRLRLRHITTFLEIAQAGSIVSAAARLGVTQPAVSKTLRELEDLLGQQLFDRSGRGLRLNTKGQGFQKQVGSAMTTLARATGPVPERARTKLTIGALPTAATRLLPQAALKFRETHPHCLVRVSTGPNWLLLSQLREGRLDLVVGRMAEADRMEGLSFRQIYTEDVVAVVRADHPWADRFEVSELGDFPLILPPPGAVIGPLVRSFLRSVGVDDLAPAYETVSLAFARQILRTTDAIWFISRGVVADELSAGSLRALSLNAPMMAGPVGISLRDGVPESGELSAMVAALEAVKHPLDITD
jgi:LysR family transcriptional regulator, pca operon transcriptional activator